jgi:hypothetical protein
VSSLAELEMAHNKHIERHAPRARTLFTLAPNAPASVAYGARVNSAAHVRR